MSAKTECLAKVQPCRSSLTEWLEKNPAVLLRWLHDAGALPQNTFFRLLESRPERNQVTSLLEIMLRDEESCKTLIHVLQQVQEHYGPELHYWLKNTFPLYFKQPTDAIDIEKPVKKTTWDKLRGKFKRGKTYKFDPTGQSSSKPAVASPMEAALQNHRRSLLKQNMKIQGKLETSHFCSEMFEIRYTELFIVNEDPTGKPSQHEYFMLANRRARIYQHNKYQHIGLTDMFSPLDVDSPSPKKVLITGIAGIGKTSASQRLMHEWAIGKALQNFSCAIGFAFREMSLLQEPISLVDFIKINHVHLQNVAEELCSGPEGMLVVLDGLDEFKHSVSGGALVSNAHEPALIKDLVNSLLRGSLLPGASIVVTSRPRTSLPFDMFDRRMVILGFEERQVKEFCFRFFREERISEEVFRYVMENDTLSGLSFIPLYCSIICTALSPFFQGTPDVTCLEKPPQTMTEVYRSYLCTTMHLRESVEKVGKEEKTITLCSPPLMSAMKNTLYQLGKLAYHYLLANKILFSIDDLKRFGFDPAQLPDSFMQRIFVCVDGQRHREMFSFFHMTVQEFFAALYCVMAMSSGAEELQQCLDFWCFGIRPEEPGQSQLLHDTLELQSGDCWEGLQMFSRFFMGLVCLRLERKLLGLVDSFTCDILAPLTTWFKDKMTFEVNQRLLNLLHCLRELRQQSVVEDVAPVIDEVDLFKVILNPADCATLSYVLQQSPDGLRTLNLGYTNIGIQGLRRLRPLLHRCHTLYLRYNSLGKDGAALAADVLKSPTCQVRSLLMCGNNIGSEGAQRLWEALRHNRTLEELYLDINGITDAGLDNLLPFLESNKTLRLLTIVGNRLSERGKEALLELQRRSPQLKILSSFMGDMGLLQAYLDWVQDLNENPQQMESVTNVDGLHNILAQLAKEDAKGTTDEVIERMAKLKREIQQLLRSSSRAG